MEKILIVNADDYGQTPAVSAGIRKAYIEGIVRSTSAMVCGTSFFNDIELLRQSCPGIGVGVHLTLTTFTPIAEVSKIKSLVNPYGDFFPIDELSQRIEQINPSELYTEWKSQIIRLSQQGIKVSHLDSHHNAAYLGIKTLSVILKLAKEFALPIRSCPDLSNTYGFSGVLHKTVSYGIPCPDYIDVEFTKNSGNLGVLLKIFDNLSVGITEIVSHPGFVDNELRDISSLVEGRQRELISLCDPFIGSEIRRHGITLSSFSNAFL